MQQGSTCKNTGGLAPYLNHFYPVSISISGPYAFPSPPPYQSGYDTQVDYTNDQICFPPT